MKRNFTVNIILILKILVLIFISRLSLYILGFISINTFPMYDSAKSDITNTIKSPRLKRISVEDFNKFDSGFYFQIADIGYPKVTMSESNSATRISFFPLYPLLIRAMRILNISSSNLINALILSNGLLLFALFYIYKICELRRFSRSETYFTLALILCYPSSIFYSVPYTESLFLCLSAATLYYSMKGRYINASIFAGLSAITRFPGFVNVMYIFLMMLSEINNKKNVTDQLKKIFMCMVISIIPISIYFSYMKYLTGDFLAPLHDVNNWGRKLSIPFKSYVDYIFNPYFLSSGGWNNGIISFCIATAVLGVFILYAILYFRKLTIKEVILLIYGFLVITIPFSNAGSDLVSIPRYLMVSIPMYFYIVELCKKYEFIFLGYLFLFTIFNALTTIGYFNGYHFVV